MHKLIAELKKLSLKCPLQEYHWEIPANVPIKFPEGINTNFSQNIFLKENFSCYLQEKDLANYYWIIQQWGKIGSFKKNDRNDINIVEFIEKLKSKKLTKKLFNLISSLSKVASYLDHRNYAIYDSRAIYSLNWLIFCNSQEKILYPQPTSRSSELAKYDMQTIFRLSKETHSYYSHKIAYFSYCELLKKLSKEVYGEENPYKIEMLLFRIAPTEIIHQIESSVALKVTT